MNLEEKNVNALRILAVDMIERAKSGHPGIALGSAPILYSLYSKHLNVVPSDDKHILRDRFVMSAGHGSSIYYATLHAFGYDISIDDLKNFRKLDTITPGHPEYGLTPGIDATTGPLGQGVAMAVGMAIAERIMASKFNKNDIELFDNYTYTLVGEGCLMEGVSYEALSLAGSLKLNKLIVLYDCNKITLDGNLDNVMNMDVLTYVKSIGFNTIEVLDGNDVEQISKAIEVAKQSKEKPTFIKINTHIGYGSVLQDSHKSHGSILGADNVNLLREKLNVTTPEFELGKEVTRDLTLIKKRFKNIEKTLKEKLKNYSKKYPNDYILLQKYLNKELNFECLKNLNIEEDMSGRDMGGLVLNELAKSNSNIVCLSADLFSSTKAYIKNSGYVNENFVNNNLKCGIREFAMGSISNGISLYGGLIPVQSTFMVFSDYMKNALRLSALMKTNVVSLFTHDSIAVGEDGATHQCCEQLCGLRSTPNTNVFRPANLGEVEESFKLALTMPNSIIALSRQKLKNSKTKSSNISNGAYIIDKEREDKQLDAVILATGSEVGLAIDVKQKLGLKGYNVRVVSMPCLNLFDKCNKKTADTIIPENLKSVFSIEAGATMCWYKYTGKYGKCYGVDGFGSSATPNEVYDKFNLNIDFIAKDMEKIIKRNKV